VTDAASLLGGLDEQQREAARRLLGPVCLLAGAGTGKTRAITHRIAYGVATGVYAPSRVMALTFTSRAAAELRGRLRELGRGARREGERHHPVGRVDARLDPVRDAVRDGPRLARAGAREHDDGAEERLGGQPLLVVERLEQGLGGRDLGVGLVGGRSGGTGGEGRGGDGGSRPVGVAAGRPGDELVGHDRRVTTPARRPRGVRRTTPR
jgi:hypothetical protein